MPAATVPVQSTAGWNRTRSVARTSRALLSATAPMSDHPTPPLVEYCHVPFVLSMAVTARPSGSPSASVTRSPPAEAMTALTVSPALPVSFSSIGVKLILPVLSKTGALLASTSVKPGKRP